MFRASLIAIIFWLSPLMASSADSDRGARLYGRCTGCHSLDYDRTGPRHCGLIGRKAGAVPGFVYSSAMKNSSILWSVQTLDVFLQNPRAFMPGNRMPYAGIKNNQDRADLIAFLVAANDDPKQCAQP